MATYPLSEQMMAFVEKTISFNGPDNSLAGMRQAYREMWDDDKQNDSEAAHISHRHVA